MNIVDSSGWLEYFADGPNALFFSQPLQKIADLVVPTITIYEVFKVVLRQRTESDALQAIALMQQGAVVDLTSNISITAAKLSIEHHLPMADSIILATGHIYGATLWTQDSDFKDLHAVRYIEKKSG
ncbi:Predicted nucleic acid-binding protein, contains PIN domain [Syntrophus gentianae]|uniref:Predicted nucleic acid-binding protein, contains PIN domain n=1 Tax=Syntrophus gentianae TaxID=43775 RepID=A0A1H8AM36_9BACT|nr:type II toxin-antitoxin system VapC family toxin [Syntrophus gentianae]SEM71825.1 Predicted nucleic acid-binding protein, contains PIN domain [Syntrophus gentianae]